MAKKENLIKKMIKRKLKKKILAFLLSSTGLAIGTTAVVFIAFFGALIYMTEDSNNSNAILNGVPSEYIEYYNEASTLTGIPNWVLAGITKQESNFRNIASSDGAYGVMQQQRYDFDGSDIYKYYLDLGLGDLYRSIGYEFETVDEIWEVFLNDIRLQIITGAYETRHYANYVLYKKNIAETLDYNSTENMKLIDWNADENDPNFREILRRIFACYNGGPSYGMKVDLDNAQNNYPNNVFKYAIEFRNSGLVNNGGGAIGDNETIETAINAGMQWVGKSPYVWGGGRTQADVDAGRFDCSSFVHYCYASAGIQLGDRASAVTFSMVNMGKGVSPSEMKRGDLIFFDTYTKNGHIAIYLGNGEFLHDGTTHGVWINNLNEPYWTRTFNGNVRRIIE
ncbi:MAG: NlpC/P60 family protein [Clostridium perfringens]|uniref:C40 family peptidase n=1 Tax=Clostridium perfringens TaxID=1502 RepID=A0ABD4PR18_CLOPF|nr:NlpC/P60 family protein [Clostridium perfringens]EGT3618130.1 cell wall-binding protein [Clostridium perfringens]EGT4141132.1 cell wall-binding protein [Clostridium perfringens]EHK2347333.1 C40 family peptidase [Clostridium perfringens]MBO3397987.1 C40 family peptidase [Clostridium perfringens]MBO3408668.1 C40 family peptidase [Clostridium perfringens]